MKLSQNMKLPVQCLLLYFLIRPISTLYVFFLCNLSLQVNLISNAMLTSLSLSLAYLKKYVQIALHGFIQNYWATFTTQWAGNIFSHKQLRILPALELSALSIWIDGISSNTGRSWTISLFMTKTQRLRNNLIF